MAGLTAALLAAAVAVADVLPLAHGTYVRAGTDCRKAGIADTVSYWGGDGAINSQQMSCRITREDHVGPTYRLEVRCTDLGSRASVRTVQTLRIESRTAFLLYGNDRSSQPYRFCGPRVQPLGR